MSSRSGYYDAYYLRAQKVRTLIRQDFLKAYEQVDAILTPTSPTPAFLKGEKAANPLAMYLSDIYTIGVNLAGLPGTEPALRIHQGRAADRTADHRPAVQGGRAPRRGRGLREGNRLADAPAEAMTYEAVIGLEVHVQLKTRSKMFTRAAAGYGQPENTLTDPVVLALPGTLPVMNKAALDKIIKTGLLFGCEIAAECKWDRKNYFYPDSPKNYQISQYDRPICLGGAIEIELPGPARNIMGEHKTDRPDAHPPRGGRGQAEPRRRGLPGRLQPGRHAAHGDRFRAGRRQRGRGLRLPDRPQGGHDLRRDIGLRHGEGAVALRRQHLHPAGRGDPAGDQGRAQEPELLLLCPRRHRPRDPPADRGRPGRGQDRPGDPGLRRADRGVPVAPLEGDGPRLPVFSGSGLDAGPGRRGVEGRARRRPAPSFRSTSSAGS